MKKIIVVILVITSMILINVLLYGEKVCPKCREIFSDKYFYCPNDGMKLIKRKEISKNKKFIYTINDIRLRKISSDEDTLYFEYNIKNINKGEKHSVFLKYRIKNLGWSLYNWRYVGNIYVRGDMNREINKSGTKRFEWLYGKKFLKLGEKNIELAIDVFIENPAGLTLTEVSHYDCGGRIYGIDVLRNYAYILYGYKLEIIDISNKTNPIVVGFCHLTRNCEARGIYVAGDYAYVVDVGTGLTIIDISNKTTPTEVGYYYTNGSAGDVHIVSDYAYVADSWGGLRIIDISNKTNPTEVGYYDTDGYAVGIYVMGDYAYVADYEKGLRIIDISDKTSPREVGYYDTDGYAVGIYVVGDYAYVADYEKGLRIIDVNDKTSPREVGYYDIGAMAEDIHVSGGYAYITDSYFGLRIIDIDDKTNPREVCCYDIGGIAKDIYVLSDYVYVTGVRKFRILKMIYK